MFSLFFFFFFFFFFFNIFIFYSVDIVDDNVNIVDEEPHFVGCSAINHYYLLLLLLLMDIMILLWLHLRICRVWDWVKGIFFWRGGGGG